MEDDVLPLHNEVVALLRPFRSHSCFPDLRKFRQKREEKQSRGEAPLPTMRTRPPENDGVV